MTTCCNPADPFWPAQLAAAQKSAVAIQAAIDALTIDGMQTYQLDTGQMRQLVTKLNLTSLNTVLQSTLNRVATLQKRLGLSCGATHIAPNT